MERKKGTNIHNKTCQNRSRTYLKIDAKSDPPETSEDANIAPGQGYGGEGGNVISIYQTFIYQFHIFDSVIIYQYIFDTYF